ncbi:hypothetical protein C8P68_101422 [Mucilaginibacter yixingensis]|uniref:Lipoprotein n=1 Tax=Mucilaginibacter yixingensis TaxID=1295612 RepID=A0A2T5JFH9_9SPHI|nr:hypothetical protein [Mucilaginibacter yixingensis]PTR01188.1 hypothetical protein C8P68_101422 [Mucilaginibacter yixingensis]
MKPFYKMAALALAGASLVVVSCKKNATTPKDNIDYAALAQQLAKGLSSTSATANVKTNAASTLKIFDITSACGTSEEKANTNQSIKLGGDTTENVKRHTIFTYLCENGSTDPNAYTQRDTSVDTYSGSAFRNSRTIALNWHVSAQGSQERLLVNGDSKSIASTAVLKDGATTSSYSTSFDYHWTNVLAIQDYTFKTAPYFDGGKVDYTCVIENKKSVSDDQITNLSGTIQFMVGTGGNMWVTFNPRDGFPLLTYIIDAKTGKATQQ